MKTHSTQHLLLSLACYFAALFLTACDKDCPLPPTDKPEFLLSRVYSTHFIFHDPNLYLSEEYKYNQYNKPYIYIKYNKLGDTLDVEQYLYNNRQQLTTINYYYGTTTNRPVPENFYYDPSGRISRTEFGFPGSNSINTYSYRDTVTVVNYDYTNAVGRNDYDITYTFNRKGNLLIASWPVPGEWVIGSWQYKAYDSAPNIYTLINVDIGLRTEVLDNGSNGSAGVWSSKNNPLFEDSHFGTSIYPKFYRYTYNNNGLVSTRVSGIVIDSMQLGERKIDSFIYIKAR